MQVEIGLAHAGHDLERASSLRLTGRGHPHHDFLASWPLPLLGQHDLSQLTHGQGDDRVRLVHDHRDVVCRGPRGGADGKKRRGGQSAADSFH